MSPVFLKVLSGKGGCRTLPPDMDPMYRGRPRLMRDGSWCLGRNKIVDELPEELAHYLEPKPATTGNRAQRGAQPNGRGRGPYRGSADRVCYDCGGVGHIKSECTLGNGGLGRDAAGGNGRGDGGRGRGRGCGREHGNGHGSRPEHPRPHVNRQTPLSGFSADFSRFNIDPDDEFEIPADFLGPQGRRH